MFFTYMYTVNVHRNKINICTQTKNKQYVDEFREGDKTINKV